MPATVSYNARTSYGNAPRFRQVDALFETARVEEATSNKSPRRRPFSLRMDSIYFFLHRL